MEKTEPTLRRIIVPPDLAGARADKIVATVLEVSRTEAKRICDLGNVRHDQKTVDGSDRLASGTHLVVTILAREEAFVPLAIDLDFRYASEGVLVVNKPAGLVAHPGAGHRNDTLANALVHHYGELAELAPESRWGLVHRLDRDTSGLLLVARSDEVHGALQLSLQNREVTREYLTLVATVIDPVHGTVEASIGRDPGAPTKMALRQNGRFARTHYRRLAGWRTASLLSVTLDTGRTHQIRVHMAAIDAPVVGDRTYGAGRHHIGDPGRVWLHACRLKFHDPTTSTDVEVTSPLPSDLQESLHTLGVPDSGQIPAVPTES